MKRNYFKLFIVLITIMFGTACDGKINFFTLQDDKDFGAQFDQEIQASSDFFILKEEDFPDAYEILNQYMTTLLSTGKLKHKSDFNWKVRIIHDDVINAFAVPGGYLYFYTGLIKTLDNEAEFVGVLAHEMAHVDLRHSTSQLSKAYGKDLLLSMLLGNYNNQWVSIAADLASGLTDLAFSRKDENEADKMAVNYTYVTNWDARGVADFFAKMDSHSKTPVFLSTHPSDEKRIEKVNTEWEKLGGRQGQYFEKEYKNFVNYLP